MNSLAVVWHYWIAVPLAAGAVLVIVATSAGYRQKGTYQRYPHD